MRIETVRYRCDRCGKDAGTTPVRVQVKFRQKREIAEGDRRIPIDIEFCAACAGEIILMLVSDARVHAQSTIASGELWVSLAPRLREYPWWDRVITDPPPQDAEKEAGNGKDATH